MIKVERDRESKNVYVILKLDEDEYVCEGATYYNESQIKRDAMYKHLVEDYKIESKSYEEAVEICIMLVKMVDGFDIGQF